MILVDSELGLTFEYTKKNGENDFYKIETRLPKDGIYKVTEIINEKSNYIIEPFLDPLWTINWWKNIGKNEYDEFKGWT